MKKRARKWEMLKADRERLKRELAKVIVRDYGAVPDPVGLPMHWIVETKAGQLRVSMHDTGNAIYTKFVEPARVLGLPNCYKAEPLCSELEGYRFNGYSGKWNFHFGRMSWDWCLKEFTTRLDTVMPPRQWYIAICPHYWGRGYSAEQALEELKKMKPGKLINNRIIKKLPAGADDPYIDEMGSICWTWLEGADRTAKCEVVERKGD